MPYSPRTLRFYEQKGLFKPIKIDSNSKYRFYDPKQARDFLKIKLLQNFHLSLKQITRYVPLRGAKKERRSNPRSQEIATPREARLAMTSENFYFKSYPKTKALAYEYNVPYEYLILVYQNPNKTTKQQ